MATAPDSGTTKQKKVQKCSICQKTLKESQVPDCFLSVCSNCMEEADREGEAEDLCSNPLCRTHELRVNKGDRVIRNLLVELSDVQKRTQRPACECCSQVAADYRCVDCECLMCTNCLTTHEKWRVFKDHEVLTLEQLAKPENKCKAKNKAHCEKPNHKNKVIEFYCNTCQKIACINCILLDHPKPDHEYESIAVVAEQHREALRETSAILEEKSKQSECALQEIERATEVIEANAKTSKDRIDQQEREILEEFTRKLKCETAALVSEVDKKHKDVKQKLVTQQNEMKAHVERVNDSLAFSKNIIEEGSNEDILRLSLREKIEVNASDIEKTSPNMTEPVHDGSLVYQPRSSKSILDTANLNDLGKIGVSPTQLLRETSTILEGNFEHAQQLVHWVDDTFGWRLCYRASQNGWGSSDFHRKCDDVGPTVTLVKCGTNVFGGYTDRNWKQPDRLVERTKGSSASFVFSLRNKDEVPAFKCEIKDEKNDQAIKCYNSCGAIFGDGHDLIISDDANANTASYSDLGYTYIAPPGYKPRNPATRSLLAGSFQFQPTEIEVFRS